MGFVKCKLQQKSLIIKLLLFLNVMKSVLIIASAKNATSDENHLPTITSNNTQSKFSTNESAENTDIIDEDQYPGKGDVLNEGGQIGNQSDNHGNEKGDDLNEINPIDNDGTSDESASSLMTNNKTQPTLRTNETAYNADNTGDDQYLGKGDVLNEGGQIDNQRDNHENDNIASNGYDAKQRLYAYLFDKKRYNPAFRPLMNESQQINVNMDVCLLSLVNLADREQTLSVDLFIRFFWTDQMLKWNPIDYAGQKSIAPKKSKIWSPELYAFNSPTDREPLGNKADGKVIVSSDGLVMWHYFNVITTTCNLDISKFPFDKQKCSIQFTSVVDGVNLKFHLPLSSVVLDFYYPNYGWDIVDTKIVIAKILEGDINNYDLIFPRIDFVLHRRPETFLVNVLIPMVVLSFLNCLVFVVPFDSGERVSASISVLLAITVFFSITSGELPKATDGTPAITLYLSLLMGNSILAASLSICNMRLYDHYNTQKKKSDNNEDTRSATMSSGNSSINTNNPEQPAVEDAAILSKKCDSGHRNGTVLTKMAAFFLAYMDLIGFFLVTGFWFSITAGYFIFVSS